VTQLVSPAGKHDGRVVDRHRINYAWLVRLRWAAIGGQLATVAVAHGAMDVVLPVPQLLGLIAMAAATNVVCSVRARRADIAEAEVAGTMALDVLLFTALLYFTGGPYNPFSFLYLVYIALGAVLLDSRYTWGLVALSLAGSAILFIDSRELQVGGLGPEVMETGIDASVHAGMHAGDSHAAVDHGGANHMDLHLRGMWVALLVASAFIVYFLLRVRSALSTREGELRRARDLAARQERLASLATLAAGAAHELATPLGTIATVARELERGLERAGQAGDALEDTRLIRQEVARCRTILQQMSADAGDAVGEAPVATPVETLLDDATSNVRLVPEVRARVIDAPAPLLLPRRAVAQAIRGVITNAQDASAMDAAVEVIASAADGTLRIEVRDRGSGMSPDVLDRAGEPFFTTKDPGRGMGLGLFLTRAVVDRLGGTFALDSTAGVGTVATLEFPASAEPVAATKYRIGSETAAG